LGKKRLPVLNADELRQILKASNFRDKAIILFMVDNRLRRAETINLIGAMKDDSLMREGSA
jgi:integrase